MYLKTLPRNWKNTKRKSKNMNQNPYFSIHFRLKWIAIFKDFFQNIISIIFCDSWRNSKFIEKSIFDLIHEIDQNRYHFFKFSTHFPKKEKFSTKREGIRDSLKNRYYVSIMWIRSKSISVYSILSIFLDR